MFLRVHQFQIDEKEFAGSSDSGHYLLRGIKRGIDSTMESAPSQFLQDGQRIIGMHQGLATTEGYASPTILHDGAFLLDLSHQVHHRPLFATHLQSSRRTILRTLATEYTGILRRLDAIRREFQSLLRTNFYTTLASNTLGLLIEFLRLGSPTFRVMTPNAPKGTPLQENGGPDTRAIINRIAFDIEYECHYKSSFSVRAMISFCSCSVMSLK